MRDQKEKENSIRPSGETYSFDIVLAMHYGIEEALLIRHFQYWIRLNKNKGSNLIDGKTWTYQTINEIADHFPFMNYEKIKYCLDNLVKKGVLVKGNFNKSRFDKTTWYCFQEEEIYVPNIPGYSKNVYERENSLSIGKIPSSTGKIPEPIPDTITNTIPTNKKEIYAPSKDVAKVPQDFKEEKIERAKNVHTTKKEHDKLIEKFGEKIVIEGYEELSEWKDSADPKIVKRHSKDYYRLRKWVIPDLLEKKPKITKKQSLYEIVSKHFKNGGIYNGHELYIDEKSLTIYSGNYSKTLNFKENGFLEQFENILRNYNIKIPNWYD